MKVHVVRFAVGVPVEVPKLVEIEDQTTYEVLLKQAGIEFNPGTMTIGYAEEGNEYFSDREYFSSIVGDGETVGVFDNALFLPIPEEEEKSSDAADAEKK